LLTPIELSPERIEYTDIKIDTNERGINSNNMYLIGRVIGGDWDINTLKIEQLDIYKALKDYFVDGIDLKESNLYAADITSKEKIKGEARIWYNIYAYDYQARVDRLNKLYISIKKSGYKSQEELQSDIPLDEVRVKIGRRGKILFENSIHRLIIAKLLKVDTIPAIVTVRHSQWQRFKNELFQLSRGPFSIGGEKLYQKLVHPDLQDIPYCHDCDDRYGLIYKEICTHQKWDAFTKGSVLDIGAYLGFFCHKLEEAGFNCYAIESNPTLALYMKKLKEIENKKFTIYKFDFLGNMNNEFLKREYTYVLVLNIFHHFIKNKASFDKMRKVLKKLKCKGMFFEAHNPNEKQMENAYRNFDGDTFVKFIVENSVLDKYKLIGEIADKRNLYYIYKR